MGRRERKERNAVSICAKPRGVQSETLISQTSPPAPVADCRGEGGGGEHITSVWDPT